MSFKRSKLKEDVDISKRHFVVGGAVLIASLVALFVKTFIRPFVQRSPKKKEIINCTRDMSVCFRGCGYVEINQKNAITPPGSFYLEHFNNACTACHLCVSACPTGVLRPSLFEYGIFGMMQPFMDYKTGFCHYECTKCSKVCPNGAILPLTIEQKQTTQIGVARFVRCNCIIFTDGILCSECSEHCPTKAIKMTPSTTPIVGEINIPEITPELCVGCGACEYACPVKPYKAIVIDGLPEHVVCEKV
jgi:ferredoxin